MRTRHKVMAVLLGGCILLLAAWNIGLKKEAVKMAASGDSFQDEMPTQELAIRKDIVESQAVVEGTAEMGNAEKEVVSESDDTMDVVESKYEAKTNDMKYDFSYLEDFIGRGKQFILKRQIQVLAAGANSVKCLEYQRSVPADNRMEFFFLLNTGAVLKGYYSYSTRETSVELSNLTEAEVWKLRDQEKAALKKREVEKQKKMEIDKKTKKNQAGKKRQREKVT